MWWKKNPLLKAKKMNRTVKAVVWAVVGLAVLAAAGVTLFVVALGRMGWPC